MLLFAVRKLDSVSDIGWESLELFIVHEEVRLGRIIWFAGIFRRIVKTSFFFTKRLFLAA